MKKFLSMTLLFTAMFLTFSACSSDDDETTYTLVYNASTWGNYAETVRIFECTDNGDKIFNSSVECKKGYEELSGKRDRHALIGKRLGLTCCRI